MASDLGGVWRTVGGRRIFIKDGQDLASAMKESGKFGKKKENNKNNREEKIKKLEEELEETKGFFARAKIEEEIRSLKAGFDNVEDYRKSEQERKEKISAEREEKKKREEEARIKKYEELKKEREQEIKEATPEKKEQFEIIQKNNPMTDEYHTGIRSPKDIKTWDEVINDEDSFAWGDFTKEDAEEALKKGSITIYSSYPIKQGTFVSTSKIQAEEYAGGKGNKVYSKEIPLNEVAWINGDEGQYAKRKK